MRGPPETILQRKLYSVYTPVGECDLRPSPQRAGVYKVVLRMSYTWLLENEEMIAAVNAIYAIA